MTMRRPTLALLLTAPLALGLASCSGSGDSAGPAPQAVVSPVPPPAGKSWTDVVAPTPGGGMLMGNPTAPIKVIEYGSLSCPHCARFAMEGFPALKEKYIDSGRVSLEFRSMMIHGIIDMPLTMLVQCAAPEAYFGLVEQLYANQDPILTRAQSANAQAEAASQLPPAQRYAGLADAFGLTEWFAERGVSTDQSHACLANTATAEQIAKVTQTASEEGINSTPSFLINGRKLENTATWGPDEVHNDPGLEIALQNAGAR